MVYNEFFKNGVFVRHILLQFKFRQEGYLLDVNIAARWSINCPYKGISVIALHSIAVIKLYELYPIREDTRSCTWKTDLWKFLRLNWLWSYWWLFLKNIVLDWCIFFTRRKWRKLKKKNDIISRTCEFANM